MIEINLCQRYHYRRYSINILKIILGILLATTIFNFAVNPYGVWHNVTIKYFNQVKPAKNNNVKLFKAIDIAKIKPEIIILGSSRTEFGLDPNHPALGHEKNSYNLGLTGTNMYEVMRYFQHAIAIQPKLKKVVLGIDFLMFNKYNENTPDFSENRIGNQNITYQDFLDTLVSVNALSASLKTIIVNIQEPNATGYFYPNGQRDVNYYIEHDYRNKSYKKIFESIILRFLKIPYLYGKYQLSEASLNHLKTIVDICQDRDIELKIFISPAHATQWETIRVAGLWETFEQWKREVVKITPVWDFSGYNSITTEPISKDMQNYIESSHYRPIVGDLILNQIFQYHQERVPKNFGRMMIPKNIESHLEKIRTDREIWAKKHPDEVKFVQKLKP